MFSHIVRNDGHPQTVSTPTEKKRGHPRWYGARFDLKDTTTWTDPDLSDVISYTTRRGRQLTVEIKAWYNLLMRGTRQYPMHNHPFTLVPRERYPVVKKTRKVPKAA